MTLHPLKARFHIAWWVRPALGALKAITVVAPRRSAAWVEKCIDRIVDNGIRPFGL